MRGDEHETPKHLGETAIVKHDQVAPITHGTSGTEFIGESKPGHPRYVLVILALVSAISFIDRQVLTMLIDPIKQDLQVSDTAMGFLTGLAFAACYVLASFPIARWSDRSVRRNVISLCLTFWSVMTVLSGLVTTYWQLALARVGVAIGEGGSTPASQSMVADLFPVTQRGRAMAVLAFGSGLGIMFGLLAGGYLNVWFDWRVAFIVVGAPGFLLAAVLHLTVTEPRRGAFDGASSVSADESVISVFAYIWSLRTFRYTMIALAFHSFCGYGLMTWAPTFMIRVHALDTGSVGLLIGSATAIGVIAGNLIGGAIVDHLGRRDERWYVWVPGAGNFIAIPCVMLFVSLDHPALAAMSFVPLLISLSIWGAPIFAMGQTLARPHMRAITATVIGVCSSFIGYGLGPLYIGVLNDLLAPNYGEAAIRMSLLATTPGLLLSGACFLIAGRYAVADFARASWE